MKHYYILIFFSLLTIVAISSCRKPIPAGKNIQANGFVIDSIKNKILPYATVYLFGGNQTFYGISYGGQPLDSAIADINGNFSINYVTKGNSVDYALGISSATYGGYAYNGSYVVDVAHSMYPFNFSTQINNLAVRARELNYAKISLKVLSNPYDTFYVRVSPPYGQFHLSYFLKGQSIDTLITTRVLPNSTNYIFYYATRLTIDSGSVSRRLIDTLNVNLSDTTRIIKNIGSIYSMPLQF